MARSTIEELGNYGQSVWIDNISRSMIESGKLKRMIGQGLRGMTSNPTIFEKAISSSQGYDEQIATLCNHGRSNFEVYDELTISDIRSAADAFLPVYESSRRLDGYVSLEINPKLAYDAPATVEEGKRLHAKVDRPNVMFKVPATEPGFKAIEELVAAGLNINITLIFSRAQYTDTLLAYLKGTRRLLDDKRDPGGVFSVASVFVSRIDTLIDGLLDWFLANKRESDKKELALALKGKAAVANSALIYKKYNDTFSSYEFKELEKRKVNAQRLLWGSTSTKNPAYSDTKYVSELIAKNTINTMPEQTFNAFLDHGKVSEGLLGDPAAAERTLADLKGLGIHIDDVCNRLLKDGVAAFEKSFDSLFDSLENKKKALCRV